MSWVVLCLTAASLWLAANAAVTAQGDLILEPVSDEYWGNNVQSAQYKRDAKNWNLQLLEKEHFLWAAPEDGGQIIYANMTMGTKDDELVISMERFASSLKAAAIEEWSWVNFKDNRTFILIANYEGCGPARSRKPWLVSSVSYDDAAFKVYLNATQKTWTEVAHTYELDWGRFSPHNTTNSNRRSLLNWNPSFSVNLNHKFPTDFFAAKKFGKVTFNIDCNECETTGTFHFAGHIASDIFNGLSAFSVSAVPNGVSLDFPLKIKASGSLLPIGKYSEAFNLAAVGIPGFTIDEVLKVGPNINFDAGFNLTSFKGAVTVGTGFTASLSNNAIAEVDLFGRKALDISGWEPKISPKPLDVSVAVGFGLELYIQTSVEISLDCLGNGFDLGLGLKLPDITISGDVKYDPIKGACKGSTQPTGAEIGINAGAALDIMGYTEIAGSRHYFVNKPLFEVGANFFDFGPYCIPFGSPSKDSGTKTSGSSPKTIVATTAGATSKPTSQPGLGPATCVTTSDGVRYRTCPNTSANCPAMGQYPVSSHVSFECYTQGEQENGNWDTSSWGKTSNGYYVSLAFVQETCAKKLPPC